MRFAVWKISTRSYLCQEFEKQLRNLSQEQGKGHLRQIMNPLGEGGLAGVLGDKLMPFVIRDSSKGDMNLGPFWCHRSAISAYHRPINSSKVGIHPRVSN